MSEQKRDIILLMRESNFSPETVDREVRNLNRMISHVETLDEFCRTHELLHRNRISSKKGKIIKALQEKELKPFWFFINKN